MEMEMYWPQRKVFMLGILALFPKMLEKQYVAVGWDISKYLFTNDDELFEDELSRYSANGYFKYELENDAPLEISPRGLVTSAPVAYFITGINSSKSINAP